MDFDIAVVGSGFAGSLMAMIAKKLGRSVVLLERGKHPRFAIGESSTPLANLLLEELAQRYDLPRISPLSKWGTWQRTYPQVGCGLKRGFTFYHHSLGRPFEDDSARQQQLLVAASPSDHVADTHWYRADFDHFLVGEAQALGVAYLDQMVLENLTLTPSSVRIQGERHGVKTSIQARFVIDASGPRGFLHRSLGLPEVAFEYLPATQGLFTHFTHVRRMSDLDIFGRDETPPYPVDDAALHHVFDGGWIWVLRFNNGITSAGVAATERLATQLNFSEGEPAWRRLLQLLPTVQEQFRDSRPELNFVHSPRLPFRSGVAAGPRWALLPSAAGFVDPLLSTGFALTLLGVSRLARAMEQDWETHRFELQLADYSRQTLDELRSAELLVAALYASMSDFSVFRWLTLLYFAAVSFAETARRLGKPELATAFLLRDHPLFGSQVRLICQQVLSALRKGGLTLGQKEELRKMIYHAIDPIDAAGLSDSHRRNWYPAKAQDLLDAAHKFGVDVSEMKRLAARFGFE
jgi:FADH2 O2-dependent halogenase